jgi:hypothetical protein
VTVETTGIVRMLVLVVPYVVVLSMYDVLTYVVGTSTVEKLVVVLVVVTG